MLLKRINAVYWKGGKIKMSNYKFAVRKLEELGTVCKKIGK